MKNNTVINPRAWKRRVAVSIPGTGCNVDAADTGSAMLKHNGAGMTVMIRTTVKIKVGAREIPSTRVSNTLRAIDALMTGGEVLPRS